MIAATHSNRVRKAVIVMMTGVLGVIAATIQLRSVDRAREAVLREDLYALRTAIDSYTRDRGQAPRSLNDLVSTGYLKAIPGVPLDTY